MSNAEAAFALLDADVLYSSQYSPVGTNRGGGVQTPDKPVQDGSRDCHKSRDAGLETDRATGSSIRHRCVILSKRIHVHSPSFAATHTLLLLLFICFSSFLTRAMLRDPPQSQDVSLDSTATSHITLVTHPLLPADREGLPRQILPPCPARLCRPLAQGRQAPFSHINRRI